MKIRFYGFLFVMLFVFFGTNKLFSQQFQYTPSAVKRQLNYFLNTYAGFALPKISESLNLAILQEFGDEFLCFPNGDGDKSQQTYLFWGHSADMFVMFIGGEFVEMMAEAYPEVYFLTNEKNKALLRQYIRQWQRANNLEGDFF